MFPLAFLASRRRDLDPLVGLVATLYFGRLSASTNNSLSLSHAISLFRVWLRDVSTWICRVPSALRRGPSFFFNLVFWPGERADVSRRDQVRVTLELVLFACWPPGPPERLAVKTSSHCGIEMLF